MKIRSKTHFEEPQTTKTRRVLENANSHSPVQPHPFASSRIRGVGFSTRPLLGWVDKASDRQRERVETLRGFAVRAYCAQIRSRVRVLAWNTFLISVSQNPPLGGPHCRGSLPLIISVVIIVVREDGVHRWRSFVFWRVKEFFGLFCLDRGLIDLFL